MKISGATIYGAGMLLLVSAVGLVCWIAVDKQTLEVSSFPDPESGGEDTASRNGGTRALSYSGDEGGDTIQSERNEEARPAQVVKSPRRKRSRGEVTDESTAGQSTTERSDQAVSREKGKHSPNKKGRGKPKFAKAEASEDTDQQVSIRRFRAVYGQGGGGTDGIRIIGDAGAAPDSDSSARPEGAQKVVQKQKNTVGVSDTGDAIEAAEDGGTADDNVTLDETKNDEKELPVIDPPVYVWEEGLYYEESETLQMQYTIETSEAQERTVPNGLIITQEVPEGWEVTQLEPPADTYDPVKRVYKWLLVGNEVKNQVIISGAYKEIESATAADWDKMKTWYSYRKPDGEAIEVLTLRKEQAEGE